MIAQWLVYGLVLSTLLGLAAAAAEVVLLRWGLETRWAWMSALVALFAIPLVAPLLPDLAGPSSSIAFELGPIRTIAGAGELSEPRVSSGGVLSVGLLGVWLIGSAGVALFFYRSHRALKRLRNRWSEAMVNEHAVWIAEESGPAVVGFFRPRIVLPRWAMELEEEEREMLVAHEAEHIRGGDMWLLLLGLGAIVALPWNPVVWWQASRLRSAMEIDCDRRVLRRVRDVRNYGDLLLKVAARPSPLPLSAAAFTAHMGQLERRVRAMTASSRGNRWLVAVGGSFAAMLLLLASCGIDQPTSIMPSLDAEPQQTVDVEQLAERPTFTPFEERPNLIDRASYARALQAGYPLMLRDAGIGGTMVVWVFLDAGGDVRNVIVEQSSGHPELDQAGEAAMRQARFTPARHGGEPVPVWIQIPITFATR